MTLTQRVLLSTLFTAVYSQYDVALETRNGPIMGLRFDPNPSTGASYDAFLGIPYGKIPARFQVAEPRDSWESVLRTQSDGPACPQPDRDFSEDCLYLNVFTPVGAASNFTKLPVMVFIHGSGFTFYSSSSKMLGPDFLVPENVILVTMNYRLGAPGFLTLGSKVAPGNLGLTDTLLALQWIQDGILVFGGDPAQVTLFGQSAGAVMTLCHYFSPGSAGLFARAIAQSGSPFAEWSVVSVSEATHRAKQLALAVGCDIEQSDVALLSCLQKVDINDIVGNQSIVLSTKNLAAGNVYRFVPVLDSYLSADKPFFNSTLEDLMRKTLPRAKPLITGFTTDEGIFKFAGEEWRLVEQNLEAFIPKKMRSTMSDGTKDTLVEDIRSRFYPHTPDLNKIQSMVRIYGESMFAYPCIQVARYFSNVTYGYLFAYEGSWASWTIPNSFFSSYKMVGASHGSDTAYLFYTQEPWQPLDLCTVNKNNLEMKKKMVTWWTSFAKSGVPDGTWEVISKGSYRVIDSTVSSMDTSAFESLYYDFWAAMTRSSGPVHSAKCWIVIGALSISMHTFMYIIS